MFYFHFPSVHGSPSCTYSVHQRYVTELGDAWPMDRVLTDETGTRIKAGYRRLLAAPDSDHEVEITEDLPLDVDVMLLKRIDDDIVHARVLLDHGEGPTLVTDVVEGRPHHADGEEFSTLADLGEEYADLEKDLLEVSALMCDLPEFHEELDKYAVGPVAFQSLECYDGLKNSITPRDNKLKNQPT